MAWKCTLNWTDNSDNEDGFRIYRSLDGGAFSAYATVGANITSYNDTSIGSGHKYRYYVKAYKGSNESDPTNTVTANLPAAPASLSADYISDTQINLSWGDVAYDQGYDINIQKDSTWYNETETAAGATSYSDTDLSGNDHRYRYAIRSIGTPNYRSAWVYSGYSYSTPSAPGTPGLSWYSQDETIRITYTKNNTYGDLQVHRSTNDGAWGHVAYDSASPYDDTGPTGGNKKYEYRIRARAPTSADGTVLYSGWVYSAGAMYSTPSAPGTPGLSWYSQDETIRVAYTKNNPYGDIDIEREINDGGFSHVAYDAASPYDDTGPTGADKKYEYRIRARTPQQADGTYEFSGFTAVVAIYSTPAAPTNCAFNISGSNAYATWIDNATYEQQQRVEYALDGGAWTFLENAAANATQSSNVSITGNNSIKFQVRAERTSPDALQSAYSTSFTFYQHALSEIVTGTDGDQIATGRTFQEGLGADEAWSRAFTAQRLWQESTACSDAAPKATTKTPFAEAVSPADSRALILLRALTEGISLTEDLARACVLQGLLSEAINLSETLPKWLSKEWAESVTPEDILQRLLARPLEEDIPLLDSVTRVMGRALSEASTLADGDVLDIARTLQEAIASADVFSRVFTLSRLWGEVIALTDSALRATDKPWSESVSVSEQLLRTFTLERELAEVVTLADSIIKDIERALAEDTPLSEAIGKALDRALSEAPSLTEELIKVFTLERIWGEQISPADTLLRSPLKALLEQAGLDESAIKALAHPIAELATLADAIVRDIAHYISEGLTFQDALGRATARSLPESILVSEVVVQSLEKDLLEDALTTDTLSRLIGRPLTEGIAPIDDLSRSLERLFAETFSLSDSVAKALSHILIESALLADGDVLSFSRTLSESTIAADTARRALQRSWADPITLSDAIIRATVLALGEVLNEDDVATKALSRALAEVPQLADGDIIQTGRVLQEALSGTDNISRSLSREYQEVLDALEAVAKATRRELSESSTFQESVARGLGRSLAQELILADGDAFHTMRTLAESAILTDTNPKALLRSLAESLTSIETLAKAAQRTWSESLAPTEVILKEIVGQLSEGMDVTDAQLKTLSRFLAERAELYGVFGHWKDWGPREITVFIETLWRETARGILQREGQEALLSKDTREEVLKREGEEAVLAAVGEEEVL